MRRSALLLATLLLCPSGAHAGEVPVNTWVRVADCPGDHMGREVPPGRGANWTHCPETGLFYRYGGYTARIGNALDSFDPAAKTWKRLWADDENHPETRPGGACEALVAWDPERKVVWIAGGIARGSAGRRGIWKYDPKTNAFAVESESVPPNVSRMAFDVRRGLFVASPATATSARGSTQVYSLAARKWEARRTDPTPQETYGGNWPLVWHEASGRMILAKSHFEKGKAEKVEVWALDTGKFAWERLHDGSGEAPSSADRRVLTIAYEPGSKSVMLYGGSDGREDGRFGGKTVWNDTWFFDVEGRKWTEVKTPGPTLLASAVRGKAASVITYRTALAWDGERKVMTFSDPDHGVWVFRRDPAAAAGTAAVDGGWKPAIGAAARSNPIAGDRDTFRKLPSPLNRRILDLADNTAVDLKIEGFSGAEIPWDYSLHHGIFMKIGGCGNNLSPYWGGYGNDLTYYDPGTETLHVRRAGDVSGADRPGTGCTRSIIYDSHRRLFWFYGGASGSPGTPRPAEWDGRKGTWAYSVDEDRFTLVAPEGESAGGPPGHACYMVYDPDHRCIVAPGRGRTWIFDTAKAAWSARETPSSPSEMTNYTRLAYVHSLKGTLRVAEVPTGRTAQEKPAEARPAKDAAGKDTVFWKENAKAKTWEEWTQKTLLYDHQANVWRDLAPKGQPTFRNNKYGLAYDMVGDVALLVGGNIGWNGPVVADIWAYRVKDNEWVKVEPQGAAVQYGQNLRVVYDLRHNATLIGSDSGSRLVAYRYKKGELPAGLMERLAGKAGD